MINNTAKRFEVRIFESNYSDDYEVAHVCDNIAIAWEKWYNTAKEYQYGGHVGVQLCDTNSGDVLAYSYRDCGRIHLD